MPWAALNGRPPKISQCAKAEEQKQRRLVSEEAISGTERAFKVYGLPLTTVTPFKYIGRILTASYNDLPAVVGNLWKLRKKWARTLGILGREG